MRRELSLDELWEILVWRIEENDDRFLKGEGVIMVGGLAGTWSAIARRPEAGQHQVDVVDDFFKQLPALDKR